MNTVFFVVGCSGTGKSTRVQELIEYLEKTGAHTIEPLMLKTSAKPNGVQIGIYFKELNLGIPGKFVEKDGIKKWQGLDQQTAKFGNSNNIERWISVTSLKMNLLIEGAGITASYRYRPDHMFRETEITSSLTICFHYYKLQEYVDRIKYRSGKENVSGIMFKKNKGFISHCKSYENELAKLPDYVDYHLLGYDYSEPVHRVGALILLKLASESELQDFCRYSRNSDITERLRCKK